VGSKLDVLESSVSSGKATFDSARRAAAIIERGDGRRRDRPTRAVRRTRTTSSSALALGDMVILLATLVDCGINLRVDQ